MLDKKERENLLKKLEVAGLTDKEGTVYLSLLAFDTAVGSSKIVRSTGLHGQYVYQALDSLESKGLTRHHIERGRKKFSANPPARLRFLVEKKRLLVDSIATQLSEAFASKVPQSVEMYEGGPSLIAHQYELLEEGGYIDVIGGGAEQFWDIFGPELMNFDRERSRRNIPVRYLGLETQRAIFEKRRESFGLFRFRVFPGLTRSSVDTQIRPRSITFGIYGDPVIAITVKNETVAARYREFFETLWELGRKENTDN